MRLIRAASHALAIALAVAGAASAALAQNAAVCAQLQTRLSQLDQISARGGSQEGARSYDGPITEQQREIARASAAARRYGCVSGLILFQPPSRDPRCDSLMATLDRMRANLSRLMAARSQRVGDPFALARQRSDILRAMQANRCGGGGPSTRYVYTPREGVFGGLFSSLFGQPRFRTYGEFGSGDMTFGTYRTLCVRTCDGYYFPISFSTVPTQFDADATTCQQMCPGAEVSLYTYRNPGGDVSEMVSLAGESYASLPTAFLYRKQFDKSCTCGSAVTSAPQFTQFETAGGTTVDSGAARPTLPMPLPIIRPALGEDPETIANRAGELVPRPTVLDDGTAETTDAGKKIRTVGPDYYYAQ